MLKYLIDTIYCHVVVGLMYVVEGLLFMHIATVPCHKLPITQSTVSSPTDYTVCKCLIIKLSIQAVTMVNNHSKAYSGHMWVGTYHRLTNLRPDRPSQNATAQSGAWEARHAIQECISPDRLSQDALQICTK